LSHSFAKLFFWPAFYRKAVKARRAAEKKESGVETAALQSAAGPTPLSA
jgi:hypothetical protein